MKLYRLQHREVLLLITFGENVFRLDTENTTYIFRVTKFGHLEHIYYGNRLPVGENAAVLAQKRAIMMGSSVLYDTSDDTYCLNDIYLEWSDNGRGDYRQSPTELKMPDGSFVSDFVYTAHRVETGSIVMDTLPSAYGADETLVVDMKDTTCGVRLTLFFSVHAKTDVITRRAVLSNEGDTPLVIRRIMSMMIDLPDEGFDMLTLDGSWIREAHLHRRPVEYGITVNSSTSGDSSNKHNPGFMLAEKDATEDHGRVFGFNLVYSGNHYGSVEKSEFDTVRAAIGINPHCFEWELKQNERFETPEAVMTFSGKGTNGMSHNMHDFIGSHIVRGDWKNRERPVLLNNWEATFFNFNENKLLGLAKTAKELGIELFVLDDGWFGARSNDKAGLGDYTVNLKKLPHGLKGLSDKLQSLGLGFGLWFEPEMVNEDSDLYRAHPEYAVRHPARKPVLGRNQRVLDLCNGDVRDYIVSHVGAIIDEAGLSYVKWDMNRHIAEGFSPVLTNQGAFYHRYIMGLYDILTRLFSPRPHVLLESCSSGGNRFDLGMLCYSPQIWCSDDTDPVERLKIQTGLSYLYPPSTMGAHVSQTPHQQTLRNTPLATRFHAACFGCLGYELDLGELSPEEKKDVAGQIEFYKKYRQVFQYGTFSRVKTSKTNKVVWQSVGADKKTAVTGFFQTLATAAESGDRLVVTGLTEGMYKVRSRPQRLYLERFGGLVNHILPMKLNPGGLVLHTANKLYSLNSCIEDYICSDAALRAGIPLTNQFSGTGYNENIRMPGDFGSDLYITEFNDMGEAAHE
jgi:alpha-galactosidase